MAHGAHGALRNILLALFLCVICHDVSRAFVDTMSPRLSVQPRGPTQFAGLRGRQSLEVRPRGMAPRPAEAEEAAAEPEKKLGWMSTKAERKKLIPLGLMFFCILFNYTILRDTKDVLVVTAPKSGAEIIPFLKTYVQLPGAIVFTALYSKMSNTMSQEQVFYTVVTTFLAFFALLDLSSIRTLDSFIPTGLQTIYQHVCQPHSKRPLRFCEIGHSLSFT